MSKRIKLWLPYIMLFSILLLGAYLRLYKISAYMTFLGDEGRDVLIVKRMIVDGKWTLLGPTASVGGFFMGPIYYYFMVPFLWLWRLDPVGPAIMVALFGIATIYLMYHVGKDVVSTPFGLLAASLYAVSPLVIAYSRSSWNPNIVPFFALLLFYALWKLAENDAWQLFFGVGVLLGIGLQLHYTFLFLYVVTILWMLTKRRLKIYWKQYVVSGLGIITGLSPFLAFEVRHGFANIRSIVAFVFQGKDTGFSISHFTTNITDVFYRLFSRLILRFPDQNMSAVLPAWQKNIWGTSVWLLLLMTTGISIYLFLKRKEYKNQFSLLFLWLGIVLLFFGLYKKSIYDYYFGIMFFVPFFLTALVITTLWQKRWGKILAAGSLVGLLVLNWQGRPFRYIPNHQLAQAKLIAEAVLSKTDGKPFNFALISGGNSDHAYRYFFEIWNYKPITIENIVNDPDRQTVTDQLLVVCEYSICEPIGHSLWEIAGFGRAEIAGVWDVSVVKVYKLVHYTGQ